LQWLSYDSCSLLEPLAAQADEELETAFSLLELSGASQASHSGEFFRLLQSSISCKAISLLQVTTCHLLSMLSSSKTVTGTPCISMHVLTQSSLVLCVTVPTRSSLAASSESGDSCSLARQRENPSLDRGQFLCVSLEPTASLNWWNLATVVILVRKSAHCSCVLIGSSSTCCLFT